MNKWSFNFLLLRKLSDVLDISESEIARRCGMKQQVFNRYTNEEVMLSMGVLMKICNSLRMPAYYFVSEDNKHEIPNRECATIPLDYWMPISWDMQAAEQTFGNGAGRIHWKDVAEAMGVTEQKPRGRFMMKTRFPVDDFLKTCNVLNLSPFLFLVDKNRDTNKRKNGNRKATVPVTPAADNNDGLRADIKEMAGKLADMNAAMTDITAKYDDLLRRHTALLDRHNELERRFNDFVGYDRTLTAADQEDM